MPGVSNRYDGNRWSENQSIKLLNWYRSIDNHTKTVHQLLSIGTATSNRRHARYLSDHPPFLGSTGDEIGKTIPTQSSQRKEYTPLHVSLAHLTVIAFPCHYIYARSPGRGFTEYKAHRQRLSSVPFWGERRRGVYATIKVNPVGGGVRARSGDLTNFKIFWSNSPGWETKGQSKVSKKPPPRGKNLNKQYYNTT